MTCTICLLLLLVAEAVFFTEIYTQGKKMNSSFRICTYRNIQMKINVGGKSLSQYFYHAGVRKTDHPYTFKSSTVSSQTMQSFRSCIIEQITLKTGKTKV